jgi:hypothetical protein
MKLLLVSTLALTGCADLFTSTVTFGDSAAAAVDLEIDIAGDCNETGERIDELGVTRWTETTVGEGPDQRCSIHVTWDGDLISLADMRQDTIAECGEGNDNCNPDDLELSLTVRLESAVFTAGVETMSREQLRALTASASTTGGAVLFTMDRTSPLPVEFGPDPAVKAALQQAYLVSGSLPVHAEATLELAMTDVRRLQEGSSVGTLSVGFTSILAGSIEAHL